ncbi:hypothetical protein TTHERM_00262990 (macronuclear) [Tetrahymena thermophila SB210]|uniref:Transmembrane protein n=1 Tax=Tetrahymena thermophila (strain SB210) TaxID=312017 RepID=Q22U84_TETTS|nr:hypothetical protein TTHERM_00262990 [Tetrahymena thermophila SB210]EAR88803.2 hypothetical protein TTHERM_00262990 [Tetrahymena thermophila SB210]|eukprot:XP_001009048.2 hypothetical protein TTHERM_00262990 [Tetrahymena thermophila SB210]
MIALKLFIFVLFANYILGGNLKKQSSKGLNPYTSNKGEKSYYSFQFVPDNRIETGGSIQIIFPQDFDALSFPNNLECRVQTQESNPFQIAECSSLSARVIKVTLDQIPATLITVIVGEVTNPRFTDTSSQFKIRSYRNDVLIDSNDGFGFISFSQSPGQILNPNIFRLSNSRIREGSSWEFSFTPSQSYPAGCSLRFTFPEGYTSKQALCDVQGLAGQNPNTLLLFNQRIVTCQNVNKDLNGPQVVKIINMVNPSFSSIMQGFKIEILEGLSSIVLESVTFPGNIEILPGNLKATYVSDDQFKWSTTNYYFFVNLINPVYLGDRLYFNFTSDWNIFQPNCTIINGFIAPFGQKVRCQRIQDQNSYMIDNFVQIDNSQRLVFSVYLETPHVENQYPVTISTYSTNRSAVVDLNTIPININSTYGIIKRFTAHALKSPQTSKAGENGALEMTFFLKTQLPKTDVGTEGHFRVDIFPQIPVPDDKYGVLKCFFYGDIPSENDCKTDYKVDKPERTYIHIHTPNLRPFKESEVPISVTTISPLGTNKAGIKLHEIVQRYKIHINIWKDPKKDLFLTPDTPPDEVYFTEFIPESYKINDPAAITTTSTITNANAFTYFEVRYVHADNYIATYDKRAASDRNYVLRIHFISGFASDLGWGSFLTNPTDQTIRKFPCYLEGTLISQSSANNSGKGYSNCELVWKDTDNTYIQVNDLPTLNFLPNAYLVVGVPKVKIVNVIGASAIISVRIVEETPRCWDQIVTLYQKENIVLFTVTAPFTNLPGNGLTVTPVDSIRLNFDSKYQFNVNQVGTSTQVVIEWPNELQLDFGQVSCTGGSCRKFNYPINWIIFTPSSPQTGSTVSFTMPTGTTQNYKNKADIIFSAQTWVGNTISSLQKTTYSYQPVTMSTTQFSCIDPNDYKFQGYQQKQDIEITLEEPMEDNWYIKLDLVSNMIFQQTDNFYFKTVNLVGLDDKGVLTELKSPTSFWIYNLKSLAKGVKVTITISITMATSAVTFTPQIQVKTLHNYYRGSTEDRSVNVATISHKYGSITLTALGMVKFTAMNPISYRYELIQGSTGPFNFKIAFSNTIDPNNASNDKYSLLFKFQLDDGSQDGFDWISASQVFACTITDDTTLQAYFHECSATKDSSKKQLIVELTPYTILSGSKLYQYEISSDQMLSINSYYGLKFPKVGGYYNFEIWVRKIPYGSSTPQDSLAYYEALFVRPPELRDIQITLLHRTPGIKNVFTFDMKVKDAVPAYSSGGRIRIYFPGYQNGQRIFDTNLNHDSILYNAGCRFLSGFVAENSQKLMCSIGRVNSDGEWNDPFIELMNFQGISANSQLVMQVGNVANPQPGIQVGVFKIHTYNYQDSAATNNIINTITETVVFDLQNSPSTIINSVNVQFQTGQKLNSGQTYLNHAFQINQSLQANDIIITEMPCPLRLTVVSTKNQNNLLTCDLSKYSSCVAFDEGNYIVWTLKNPISANTLFDARIDITGLPSYAESLDTIFYSYVVRNSQVIYKIQETIPVTEWAKIVDNINFSISTFSTNTIASCIYQRYIFDITFTNTIPAGGSILITPNSGVSNTDLRPKCILLQSTGTIQYNDFSKYGGMLGCPIQNGGWYFSTQYDIPANSKISVEAYSDNLSNPSSVSFTVKSFQNTDPNNIQTTGKKLDIGSSSQSSSSVNIPCVSQVITTLDYNSITNSNIIPFSNQETIWQFTITTKTDIKKDDFVVFSLVNGLQSDFYGGSVDVSNQWFYQPADFTTGTSSIGGVCMFYVPSSKPYDTDQRMSCTNFNNDITALSTFVVYLRIKNPSFSTPSSQDFTFYTYRRGSFLNRYNVYDSTNFSYQGVYVRSTFQAKSNNSNKGIQRSTGALDATNVDLTPNYFDSSFSCDYSEYTNYPTQLRTCQLFSSDIVVAFTTLYDDFMPTQLGQTLYKVSPSVVAGTFDSLKGCGALIGRLNISLKVNEKLKFSKVINNPSLYYFSSELKCTLIYYKESDSWTSPNPTLTTSSTSSCNIDSVGAGSGLSASMVKNGFINNESRFVGKVSFNISRKPPLYSRVYITITGNAKTQLQFANKVSQTGQSSFHSPLIIVPIATNQYELIGLPQLSSTISVAVYFGLRSQTSSSIGGNLKIVHPNGRTSEFDSSFSFSSSGVSTTGSSGYRGLYKMKRYMRDSNQKGPLQFQFQLRNFDITSADKLTVTIPSQFSVSTNGKQLSDYQLSSPPNQYSYWLHGTPTSLSNPSVDIAIGSFSSVQRFIHGNDYSLLLTTRYADSYDGFQYPANIGYYKFTLKGYQGANAQEYGTDLLSIEAEGDQTLQVTALNTNIGHPTVINFQWQITVAALLGDEIWLEFQTNNGRPPLGNNYNMGFENLLGQSNIHSTFECIEATNVISTTNILTCELFRLGDSTQNPASQQEVQAAIRIPILKPITANTKLEFYIQGIVNPIYPNRKVRITASLRKTITGFEDQPKLAYQKSYGQYQTTNGNIPVQVLPVPPSTTTFSATNTVHTGGFYPPFATETHTWQIGSTNNINQGDWIKVVYTLDNNPKMGSTCKPLSDASPMCVFPTSGFAVAKYTGTSSGKSATLLVKGMQNGIYRYAGQFTVYHWSGSDGSTKCAYLADGLTYQWDEDVAFQLGFQPYMTPVETQYRNTYWLTDFLNVVQVNITGIWKYSNIKSFWLDVPPEITYADQSFCNSTQVTPTANMNPYPWRFNCRVVDKHRVVFEITDDFLAWVEANNRNAVINLVFKFWIDEFVQSGPISNFVLSTYHMPYYQYEQQISTVTIDNYGVTRTRGNINISPYIQPDLRIVTFNSLRFYDRKARVGDRVEIYMLLQPMTALSLHRVEYIVFRLPEEFLYAPVRFFDACDVQGKFNTPVLKCELMRVRGQTFVNMTFYPLDPSNPNYKVGKLPYDNTVKIVRISAKSNNDLFTSPMLPGEIYNITASLYSLNTVIEKQTINVTKIIGYSLLKVDVSNNILTSFEPIRDSLQLGLFQMRLVLDNIGVIAGYDTFAAKMYSQIVFIFDNVPFAYLFDLGTGIPNGAELGCVGTGLTTLKTNKLTCRLTYGFNAENLPYITVSGYDPIPPNADVRIYITQIQSVPSLNPTKLDPRNIVPIQGGIQYVYKDIRASAFFYEPFQYLPNQNSLLAASPGDQSSAKVKTSGSNNKVLQTEDYTFTFKTSATIKTTDFFALQFPPDYFNRFSDYSQVTTANFVTKVFGISNLIYLSPLSNISPGTTVTAVIKNLINPSYSQNIPITIVGFSMIDYKQKETFNFQLTGRQILPFDKFTRVEAISSTNVGGENGISYKIIFVTGHNVPTNGAFSVTMPSQYTFSLYEMNAQCSLIGFDPVVTCMIGSQNRMDVYLNGSQIALDKEYAIVIQNVNSPNADVSSFKLTLTSYFSDNIYINQMICQQQMPMQALNIQTVKSCDLIVDSTILNAKALSLYTFKIQCSTMVRAQTDIEIILNDDYKIVNGLNKSIQCQSNEPQTLRQAQCTLQQNSDFQYVLRIAVNSIPSQSLFSIKTYLYNPKIVNKPFTFTAKLYSHQILYAQAILTGQAIQNAIVLSPQSPALSSSVSQSTKTQVGIQNIPKNGGQAATYILTIPPLGQSQIGNVPSEVRITFPQNDFGVNIGDNLSCGVYITQNDDKQFKTYIGILQLTQKSNPNNIVNYFSLKCSVYQPYELVIDTSSLTINQINISELWQHWIIKNVYNPKEYNQKNQFHIQYNNKKQVLWDFQDNILYFITKAPDFIKVSALSASPTDIRTPSIYTFNLTAESAIPLNPIVGISIQLPVNLYSTINYLESSPLNSCNVSPIDLKTNKLTGTQNLACKIYDQEILIESANFQNLLKTDTTSIQIQINKIYNPNIVYQCNIQNPDLNQYTFKIFDWNSGNIFLISSPSVDSQNCINFDKKSYDINFNGPLSVSPGLTYQYQFNFEQPAHGLKIRPMSPIGGIMFDPQEISVSNYTAQSVPLLVKIRSDVLPGSYQIKFQTSEELISTTIPDAEAALKLTSMLSSRSNFYLPISPINLNVQGISESPSPTITVGDITQLTIGYPLRVPVTISRSPSNILNMMIKIKEDQFNSIISINPPLLQISPGQTSTYFELTINTPNVPSSSATLLFSLTSYYQIVHQLTQAVKYLSFSINNTFNPKYSFLQVKLTKIQIPTSSTDINKSVFNKDSKQVSPTNAASTSTSLLELIPKFIVTQTVQIHANNATISVYGSASATLYTALAYLGEKAPAQFYDIINNKLNNGLQYQQVDVKTVVRFSGAVDHIATFNFANLIAQTNYVIHMVMQNSFGFSQIFSYNFKTSRLSFGSIISIPVRDIIPSSDIIKSLSLALRISESRIISQTNVTLLQQQNLSFNPDYMIKRDYYYEIVITPDTQNDQNPTSLLASKLQNDAQTRSLLTSLLPSFDVNNPVRSIQIIQGIPPIANEIQPILINYNNATFSIKLLEQGYVFAIVQEAANISIQPVSQQIFQGKNQFNQEVQPYQKFSTSTDKSGNAIITIDDLQDNTSYVLYVTIGNHLPYSTLNLYEDDQVRVFKFRTPYNSNLGSYEGRFDQLKEDNPSLAQALISYLS